MPSFFYHVTFDLCPPAPPTSATSFKLPLRQIGTVPTEPIAITNETKTSIQKLVHEPPVQTVDNRPTPGPSCCHTSGSTVPQAEDWRYDLIRVQNIDMVPTATRSKRSSHESPTAQIAGGIVAGHGGLATKGRFEPLNHDDDEVGWGVIRLFRDAEETPGLYEDTVPSKSKGGRGSSRKGGGKEPRFLDEDCSTLCILAVPSYLTPSDFLGFVGEKTRDEVSHFRMIRTERGNRYMVLMKFRNGQKAREWRKEWNGKPFDSMEVGVTIYYTGWA